MKKIFLLMTSVIMTVTVYASPAPANAENVLWTIDQDSQAFNKHACSTDKNGSEVVICFGERRDYKNNLVGYALLKEIGKFGYDGRKLEEFKVKPSGKWKFLYRTTGFVMNEDFYSRYLILTDASGRNSVITETFSYLESSQGKTIRSYKYEGTLPNGSEISFNNIFMFY
jgi:hypothetical protein